MPTGRVLSLAFMTFYPDLVGVYRGDEVTFDARQHPSPFFERAETAMLGV